MLLSLQEIGNVNYTGWRLQVPCSKNRPLITQLQAQAQIMEDELKKWKEMVKCRREEFYELNYFNTMQLLKLREELGKVQISEGSHDVSPDVLALLQSISSQITPKIVSDIVCQVITRSEVFEPPAYPEADASSCSLESVQSSKIDREKSRPTVSIADLTNSQKEIMINISARLSCSNQLVLKSFVSLKKESDQSDYERWCSQNLNMDDSEDDSSETDSDETSSSSDSSIAETGIYASCIH